MREGGEEFILALIGQSQRLFGGAQGFQMRAHFVLTLTGTQGGANRADHRADRGWAVENREIAKLLEHLRCARRRWMVLGEKYHGNIGPARLRIERSKQHSQIRIEQGTVGEHDHADAGGKLERKCLQIRTEKRRHACLLEQQTRDIGVAPGRRNDQDPLFAVRNVRRHQARRRVRSGLWMRSPARP